MSGVLGAADLARTALLVVDVQQGFDDSAYWGQRNNPACEDNITTRMLQPNSCGAKSQPGSDQRRRSTETR